MKKYLFFITSCVSSLIYSDGFDRLKAIQDQFHNHIYQAGDLGTPQPAPEVPYIAGFQENQVYSIDGALDARHIYGILYDLPKKATRKAVQGINQDQADAFDALEFDFSRYNQYSNSGHSVLGVAAQEVALSPPTKITAAPSASSKPAAGGLFSQIGGGVKLKTSGLGLSPEDTEFLKSVKELRAIFEKIQAAERTGDVVKNIIILMALEQSYVPANTLDVSLKEQLKDAFKALENLQKNKETTDEIKRETLTKAADTKRMKVINQALPIARQFLPTIIQAALDGLESKVSRTARLNIWNSVKTTLKSELDSGQINSLNEERLVKIAILASYVENPPKGLNSEKLIEDLIIEINPSRAVSATAGKAKLMPLPSVQEVQGVIDNEVDSTGLLNELLSRLKRPEINNTHYQNYRYEKLKKWFTNRKKPVVSGPILRLIQAIPDFPEKIKIDEVKIDNAIKTTLPNKKIEFENQKRELNTKFANSVGEAIKVVQGDLTANQNAIDNIDSDIGLLEELKQSLATGTPEPLRLQQLKEFFVTLLAGKDFNTLLAKQRFELLTPKAHDDRNPNPNSNSSAISKLQKTASDDDPEITNLKNEIKKIKQNIRDAYDNEDHEARERLDKELAKKAEELGMLHIDGVKELEELDEEFVENSDKLKIYQRIEQQLNSLSSRTPMQNAILGRVKIKLGGRGFGPAHVIESKPKPSTLAPQPVIPVVTVPAAAVIASAVSTEATDTVENFTTAEQVKGYLTNIIDQLNNKNYGQGTNEDKKLYLEALLEDLDIIEGKTVSGGLINIPLKDRQSLGQNKSTARKMINDVLSKLREGRL